MDEAKILGVFDQIDVINFEDFDASSFGKSKEILNIMCVATHYEGEPCDNTAKFYKWIKDSKKAGEKLPELDYTIFGLGDTSYEKFNEMSRQFNQIFGEMKANLVYQGGEGNSENQMTEEQFDEWKTSLWSSLCEHYEKSNPNKG